MRPAIAGGKQNDPPAAPGVTEFAGVVNATQSACVVLLFDGVANPI
jgi:hypothetical protein